MPFGSCWPRWHQIAPSSAAELGCIAGDRTAGDRASAAGRTASALEHVFNQQLVSGQVLGLISENEMESWSIGCGGDGSEKFLHGLQVNIYFVSGILPDSALCTFLP